VPMAFWGKVVLYQLSYFRAASSRNAAILFSRLQM